HLLGRGGAWVLGCPFVPDGAPGEATPSTPSRGGTGAAPQPDPLLPDWEGASLHRVVPTLLSEVRARGAGARQIGLLVLDGLGEEQLRERSSLAPVLAGGVGDAITSVAPSTTA